LGGEQTNQGFGHGCQVRVRPCQFNPRRSISGQRLRWIARLVEG
jgi:hypothetical protein